MRKSIFLLCGMLCCFQAFSQEAEESEAQWLIIPRVDVNPYLPLKDGAYSGFDFGSTSLYTLFEGNIGQSNFSYSVEGHLLSTDPASLYQNAFRSDDVNFLDWAYVDYAAGNFNFTLGKNLIALGSFEFDDYDFDCISNLSSTLWNNAALYQWGGSAGWTSSNESFSVVGQITASPYGERPFDKLAFSLKASSEAGNLSASLSAHAFQYYDNKYVFMGVASAKYAFSDALALTVETNFRSYENISFNKTAASQISLDWTPSETLSIRGRIGCEAANDDLIEPFGWDPTPDEAFEDYFVPTSVAYHQLFNDKKFMYGGVQCFWYPFESLENLRVHAAVAANNFANSASITAGVTYFFDLKSLFR